MRHAVLGPGGVGGLIAATLARSGRDVTVIVRSDALAGYPAQLHLESAELGTFDAAVRVTSALAEPVDVLWITCKATQLDSAMESVPPGAVSSGIVIPLLNGLDHLGRLRARYGKERVVPGAIRTESFRILPGRFTHRGWHVPKSEAYSSNLMFPTAPVQLASDGPRRAHVEAAAADLELAGIRCQLWPDEGQVIWQKLAVVAPLALAATAVGGPISAVRADPEIRFHLRQATAETIAVARGLGVDLDAERVIAAVEGISAEARVSMERDLAEGRPSRLRTLQTRSSERAVIWG